MIKQYSQTLCSAVVLWLTASASWAQAPIEERIEMAQAATAEKLAAKVLNAAPAAHWIGKSDRFWFRKQTASGDQVVIVDATNGRQTAAPDPAALTAAASNTAIEPATIPSPDGKLLAFIRDHNVWLRDRDGGAERQMTTDGSEGHAYGDAGVVDIGRVTRRRAGIPKEPSGVLWSPDGRYIVTLRADLRAVPVRLVVTEFAPPDAPFAIPHMDRYSIAADNIEPSRTIAIIDARSGEIVRADAQSSRLQDYAPIYFTAGLVWWDRKVEHLYFITGTRDASRYGLAALDLRSGKTRPVIEETETYYYSLNPHDYARPNVHVMHDGSEAVWYSQRSGYGHLYLYDARTGRLKHAITQGDWVVFDVLRIDEADRLVYFTAGGREAGRNPYYRHLYRVSLDGGEPQLLTPEDADHQFSGFFWLFEQMFGASQSRISPSGRYFVDIHSTIDKPPVMVIRSSAGKLISRVIEADATALYASGWRPPERFIVKADDGKTDLYGVLYRPSHFDANRRYAVIDQVYPGPQGSWAPQTFMDGLVGMAGNPQAIADLGFVTVALDGRGTARRSKAFRYAFTRDEDVFGAVDQKAAIENLARERQWMDTSRVGITGGSFGGYGSTRALLLYPDFFDVGVSYVGPPDFRSLGMSFSNERFFGIPDRSKADEDFYELISNLRLTKQLRGKLFLVYGGLDENVPLNHAFLLFHALIGANKDFDSLIVPNAPHGLGGHPYVARRSMEFFAEHLGPPRLAIH